MKHSMPNIKVLMENEARFQIPCYQRRYCWTEYECEVLLNDIKALVEEHSKESEENKAPHFMGSIVVQNDPTGTVWQIIDGQQRLVTMYLFYLALAQAAAAKDKDREAKGHVLANKISNILGREPKFIFPKADENSEYKINKNDAQDVYADTDAFAAICTGKISPKYNKNEDKLLSEHRMVSNYRWFYSKLTRLKLPTLDMMFKVSEYLEVIELSLERKDKPQFIFESLNTKGKSLDDWDKIRNLVLMEIPPSDLEDCYQKYWLPIERCAKFDSVFVYFYRAAKDAVSMDDDHRYVKFRQYVQKWSSNKKELLKTIFDYAEPYKRINNCQYLPCSNNEQENANSHIKFQIEQMLQFRKVTNNYWWYWMPFGMQSIMMHRDGKISAQELLDILKLIDIYLVRSFVGNFKQNDQTGTWYFDDYYDDHLEAIFLSLCEKFKSLDPGDDFVLTVKRDLLALDHWGKSVSDFNLPDNIDKMAMPNNHDFAEIIDKCPFYKFTGNYRSALMYIIARLEMTNNKEITDISEILDTSSRFNKATIEHIMPQTLNDDWKKHLSDIGVNPYEFHEIWLNRLANLTLLPKSVNSSVSNKSFEEKVSDYKNSDLSLNQEIIEHYTTWRTTNNLNKRAKQLIKLALKTWPYPKL